MGMNQLRISQPRAATIPPDAAKTVIRRKLQALIAAMLTIATFFVAVPSAQAAPTATVSASATQRMAGPTLNTTQYGWYYRGQGLALSCAAYGQAVKGYYSPWIPGGWDSLWYRTSDGGWVADVDINTGSNNPVTPMCSTSTREQRAVAWANSQVGSNAYYGLCERFVENAYGTSGRYASAIAAFYSLRDAGTMRYTSTGIPAGALVFSSVPAWDGGYGHVQISRGDGSFVSGGANGPSVKIFYGTPTGFLGWSMAPASWPGR